MATVRGRGRSRGGRGGHSGSGGHPGMGFTRLQELSYKDGREILNVVSNSQSGFIDTLSARDLRPDWVKLIMKISATACRFAERPVTGNSGLLASGGAADMSRLPSGQIMTFLNLIRTSKFFTRHLLPFISASLTESAERRRKFPDTAKDILVVCKLTIQTMPNNILHVIPVVSTLEMVLRMIRASGGIKEDEELDCLLQEVLSLNDDVMRGKTEEASEEHTENDSEKRQREPPTNFREMNVFPETEDLQKREQYLRKNKIHGAYENVEQYLDIHFRLLREDFMQPLRRGIEQYLETAHGPRDRRQNLTSIRIYQNVYVNQPVCMGDGISYRIQFDARRLKHVRWEATKRLIFGAVVCISPDSFKTAYFATVSRRHPDDLKAGFVELQFQHGSEEVAKLKVSEKLVMAESSAYFEAYKHVLQGLKETNENNLPFSQYFVNCETNIKPPSYLVNHQGPPMYDFRPLVDEKFQADFAQDDDDIDEDVPEENDSQAVLSSVLAVPVLNRNKWPTPDVLKLDDSQVKALQLALTKELAIIQGPPGTGKTHVGLKLVRLLLHNANIWKTEENSPILIICYTNHALDQFLEGICKFQRQGIVRVGGRSKSKILERFYLRELRKGLRERKDIPADVHRARMDAMDGMDKAKSSILVYVAELDATSHGVLHEDALEELIDLEHFRQLAEARSGAPGRKREGMFYRWLGLHDDSALWVYDQMQRTRIVDAQTTPEGTQEVALPGSDDDDEEGDGQVAEDERRIRGTDHTDSKEDEAKRKRIMDAALGRLALQFAELDFLFKERRKQSKDKLQKPQKEKIMEMLEDTPPMTDEEVQEIRDVWDLDCGNRWKLYKCWLHKYRSQIHAKLRELETEYELAARRLVEVTKQEDYEVMKRANVLAMTTTGAARYRDVLQEIQPRIVIIEEAAEVMEAHIVTALSSGCEHLILIGDHQQLRPNPTVFKLAETYRLKVSLFERMVLNKLQYKTLEWQHRMRPSISGLLQHIYRNLKNHHSVEDYPGVDGVSANLFFVDHDYEELHNEDLQSKANQHEADFVVALSKYLILQGYKPSQITILTPYTGQVRVIRDGIRRKKLEDVRCTAIDNYQGEENDIILLSLVRCNPDGKIGFMKENNRICVSLSRAKQGMYIIGSAEILAANSDMWSKMIESLRTEGHLGTFLPLYCQNHPSGLRIKAGKGKDFEKAPEGGCLEPCGQRLKCGHVCVRVCHTYDKQHTEYTCRKKCEKVLCPKNHRCKKICFEDCGRCPVVVKTRLTECHHFQDIPCYEPEYTFKCKAPCDYILDCGHKCQNLCSMPHTNNCAIMVLKKLPCGHQVETKCSDNVDAFTCPAKCEASLKCMHACTGTCGTCLEGRLHEPCTHPCGRTLVCGHQCSDVCTPNCPPCSEPCQNRCAHSKCQEACGVPCVPCIEPCAWSCQHYQCTKLCHEPCNRPRCDKPCKLVLECRHRCIGLCGEPCPSKCGICNKDEVQEILFGGEDEVGAKFVQLEDCGHLVEVDALDEWMDQAEDNSTEKLQIALKACPKCKTPVRRNLRYGKLIKKVLNDIEYVKKKVLDNAVEGGVLLNRWEGKLHQLGRLDPTGKRLIELRLRAKEHTLMTGQETACVQNLVGFMTSLGKIREEVKSHAELSEDASLKGELSEFKRDIHNLKKWLRKDRQKLSEQEAQESDDEVGRLHQYLRALLYQFQIHLRKVDLPAIIEGQFRRVWSQLRGGKPLQDEAAVRRLLNEVEKHVPVSGLGISEDERQMIVSAMGIGQGHWFKCPKGHVYAIGDCGGATVEGTCPECRSTIGGGGHALRRDNAFAPEMDGARRPAWLTALNR